MTSSRLACWEAWRQAATTPRSSGVDTVTHGELRFETEVVLTGAVPPREVVTTAFAMAFDGDRILLVRLADRDWHPPGGHVEAGESPLQAAVREAAEEGGCSVTGLTPIGWQRITLLDDPPADWRYPVPSGYQVFFAGRLATTDACAGTEAVEARLFAPTEARDVDWVRRYAPLYEAALRRAQAPAKVHEETGEPMSAVAPFGVQIAILRRSTDGSFEHLLLHRVGRGDDGDWAWTAPTGACFPGEDAHAAAERELFEETGVVVPVTPIAGAPSDWPWFFAVVPPDAEIVPDEDHDRREWVSLDEARRRCLPAVVAEVFAATEAAAGQAAARRGMAGNGVGGGLS